MYVESSFEFILNCFIFSVANTIAFLASDSASFITGELVHVSLFSFKSDLKLSFLKYI